MSSEEERSLPTELLYRILSIYEDILVITFGTKRYTTTRIMSDELKRLGYAIYKDIDDYINLGEEQYHLKENVALPTALSAHGDEVCRNFRSLSISSEGTTWSDSESDVQEHKKVSSWPSPIFPNIVNRRYLSVFLTHIDVMGQMHVHLEKDAKKMRQIQDFYETFYGNAENGDTNLCKKDKTSKLNWKENEPCVALYENKHWYRAVVLKADGISATILFVDFGHPFKIHNVKTELRVPFHFEDQPILCFRVIMDNVLPLEENNGWEPDTIYLLHKYLYSKDHGKILIRMAKSVTQLPIPVEVKFNAKDGKRIDVRKLFVEEFKQGKWGPLDLEKDEYSQIEI